MAKPNLSPFDTFATEDPALRLVYDYAGKVRGQGKFARLADIDFFAIPAAVPYLYTMAVSGGARPRFVYKFSGTEVDALLGFNPLGQAIDEIYTKPGHRIVQLYNDFFQRREAQIIHAIFYKPDGIDRVIARLAIPLSDDNENITHIIGATAMRRRTHYAPITPKPERPSELEVYYLPLAN